ncbi:hypothetical protein RAE19_08995 [Rhodoferax sp. TBRC 17660]|uniref:Uncharacterized protein n=1 Tax=Rhodoferax potami TaxID=3068338 RepID=A0ABU3KMV2_9BURK|nr:hypothetical protein [Rhodoferax sp. TBRC 17660]MDT7518841.1 hypothetical protein [Rhodoferax sp. TBRC 17660]
MPVNIRLDDDGTPYIRPLRQATAGPVDTEALAPAAWTRLAA